MSEVGHLRFVHQVDQGPSHALNTGSWLGGGPAAACAKRRKLMDQWAQFLEQ